MRSAFSLLVCFLSSLAIAQSCKSYTELAITVDDLPYHTQAGEPPEIMLPKGQTPEGVAQEMTKVFNAHKVPGAYAFINGKWVEKDPAFQKIIDQWVASGHPIGNHTFSHPDLNKVTAQEFLADVKKNDSYLKGQKLKSDFKYFRYPFLHEGNTKQKRDDARKGLSEMGYVNAPVTVDFVDWAWNPAYKRCEDSGDKEAVAKLRSSFVRSGVEALKTAKVLEQEVFGRPIKHVLLLHVGALDVSALDQLLSAYEKECVKFISLDEAMKDPVLRTDTGVVGDSAYTVLSQEVKRRNLKVSRNTYQAPPDEIWSICGPATPTVESAK